MTYNKERCQTYINRVEGYLLDKYEVEVIYDCDIADAYYESARCIEINNRQNYPSRLHSLLHEAGHVSLRKKENKAFSSDFPFLRIGGSQVRGDKRHRIDVIREEVLAWEAGLSTATQLGIDVDIKLWSKHRQKALITYMEWF